MKLTHVFCVLVVISEKCFVASQNAKVNGSYIIPDGNNETSLCTNDKCIMKCCDLGQIMHRAVVKEGGRLKRKMICDNFHVPEKTMDNIFDDVFIRKPNLSSFEFVSSPALLKVDKIDVLQLGFNVYLSEHAELLLEIPNAYDRWIRIPNNKYCIDSLLTSNKNNETLSFSPGVWSLFLYVPDEVNRTTTTIMIVGMLISCFFMLLVLVVYGVLPELRNLCGLILMAYVGSQFSAFLMLVVMRIKAHDTLVCEYLTYIIYFFFLASFCWMNVMSYDIWWTFRGYAKARPIHRRGERFKFLMYCLYAFGLPLAMTVGLIVLNKVDMTGVPSFITPKIPSGSCFIKEGEKLLYLYVPMLILILSNWTLFILTAFNIWRLSRGTAVLDSGAAGSSQARRLNQRRFIIYLKLSVVMGLNWVLEMLSYTSVGPAAWLISDCYNSLIGVFIFLIFVCKRKIYKKLIQRFGMKTKSKWYPNQEDTSKTVTSTDNSTSVTQEASTMPLPAVCYTPNDRGLAKITYT